MYVISQLCFYRGSVWSSSPLWVQLVPRLGSDRQQVIWKARDGMSSPSHLPTPLFASPSPEVTGLPTYV